LRYHCYCYEQALQGSDQEQLCDEDLLPEDSTDVSKGVGHSTNGRAMDVDGEEPQLQSLDDDAGAIDDELDELDLDSTAVAAAVWDGTGTFKMKTADLQVCSITYRFDVFASSCDCYGIGRAAGVFACSMLCQFANVLQGDTCSRSSVVPLILVLYRYQY
jgi:hypothetical protein